MVEILNKYSTISDAVESTQVKIKEAFNFIIAIPQIRNL